MAKIIFFHTGLKLTDEGHGRFCYYDGFITALKDAGNTILEILNNTVVSNYWNASNHTRLDADTNKLEEKIRQFCPDLVICFNNVKYIHLDKIVDCPVLVFAADKPLYFNDKSQLKKRAGNYYFMTSTEEGINEFEKEFGAQKNRIILFRPATSIKAFPCAQNKNISFIGTRFFLTKNLKEFLLANSGNLNIRNKINKIKQYAHDNRLDELLFQDSFEGCGMDDIYSFLSADARFDILYALKDMGLYIYGDNSWSNYIHTSVSFFQCYQPGVFYSLEDNQKIYNTSKICLSISHAQAGERAFPWRIPDIMASNGCLVSDYKSIYKDLYGVDIPVYKSAKEAQDICRELLVDERARKEIVSQSQHAISKAHTWEHRVNLLEEILGIKLFLKDSGKIERLEVEKSILFKSSLKLANSTYKIFVLFRFFKRCGRQFIARCKMILNESLHWLLHKLKKVPFLRRLALLFMRVIDEVRDSTQRHND